MHEKILRITAPNTDNQQGFCAGLTAIPGGVVIRAAPILKYMIGWDAKKVKDYCTKKGWVID